MQQFTVIMKSKTEKITFTTAIKLSHHFSLHHKAYYWYVTFLHDGNEKHIAAYPADKYKPEVKI